MGMVRDEVWWLLVLSASCAAPEPHSRDSADGTPRGGEVADAGRRASDAGPGVDPSGSGGAPGVVRPSDPPSPPADAPGPFTVGYMAFDATDAARRDRTLPVSVWYPVDPGDEQGHPHASYPLFASIGLESAAAWEEPPVTERSGLSLIVFSHGSGGINTQSAPLMESLASHGFVVAAPEHIGNCQSSSDDDFDTAAAQRVPDVKFIVDHMLQRSETLGDPFYARLDGRVGVVGHSFGGMTALGVKAGWAGAQPDPRVGAIIPISAVVVKELRQEVRTGPNADFSAEQLARVEVPVLLVGGTEDTDVPVQNNGIAFNRLVRAPVVYRLDIVGANHTHFVNVCAIGDRLMDLGLPKKVWPVIGAADLVEPYDATCSASAVPVEDVDRILSIFAVAFLRRHLRGEPGYETYLSESFAHREARARLWVR